MISDGTPPTAMASDAPSPSPTLFGAAAEAGVQLRGGVSISELNAADPVFWGKVTGNPWWPCRKIEPDQQVHGRRHGEVLMEFMDSSKDHTGILPWLLGHCLVLLRFTRRRAAEYSSSSSSTHWRGGGWGGGYVL